MGKKFSIEVPIYSNPVEYFAELNRLKDIEIVLYGGVPNSPFNGGRANYMLDGLFIWNRFFLRLTKKQLARALSNFYDTLSVANQNGMSFRAAFTNMFVGPDECSEEALRPVERLLESGKKYGVKNGLILNNKFFENLLRQKYQEELVYVASCTKYVSPHKILGAGETLDMYLEDSGKYDFICLTPQDSRKADLIKDVVRRSKCGVIAICNSYCADGCNSYYHYEYMSRENKKSLLAAGTMSTLARVFAFTVPRIPACPAFRQTFCKVDIKKMARMQLEAGVVHFKLGRGFGAQNVGKLVSAILQFQESQTKQPGAARGS